MLPILFASIALVGCDGDGYDTDEIIDASACPEGTGLPASSRLTIQSFVFDGVAFYPSYNANASYDDVPAACVDPEGTWAQLSFEQNSALFGTIILGADGSGTYDMNGTEGQMSLTVYQGEPVTFASGSGQWLNSNWNVDSVGSEYVTHVQGTSQGEHSLTLFITAELSP